jgi:hypothetical protein
MDSTIRNLDRRLYQQLRRRAKANRMTVGEAMNQAMKAYLAWPQFKKTGVSILDVKPEDFGPGNERLSEEIDDIVYGT